MWLRQFAVVLRCKTQSDARAGVQPLVSAGSLLPPCLLTSPVNHPTYLPARPPAEGLRFNDGKVSPQGSLLVGRMHTKWREGKRGRLYRLDPGSRCGTSTAA